MEQNYTQEVPAELFFQVLYYVPISDLFALCQTDRYVQGVCNDEYFWENRVKMEV